MKCLCWLFCRPQLGSPSLLMAEWLWHVVTLSAIGIELHIGTCMYMSYAHVYVYVLQRLKLHDLKCWSKQCSLHLPLSFPFLIFLPPSLTLPLSFPTLSSLLLLLMSVAPCSMDQVVIQCHFVGQRSILTSKPSYRTPHLSRNTRTRGEKYVHYSLRGGFTVKLIAAYKLFCLKLSYLPLN